MSDEDVAPKKSPLKLIIVIVAALAVLGGGGGGTAWFLKKRRAAKAATEATAAQAATQAEAASAEPGYGEADSDDCEGSGDEKKEGGGHGGADATPVMVLTRTLNLTGPRRNAFLRCELNILFCDTELGRLVSGDKTSPERSLIQSIVLNALSGKSVEEASDAESREALRREIKDKLNEQFKPHPPKPGEKEDPKRRKPMRPIKSVLIVDWAIQQ